MDGWRVRRGIEGDIPFWFGVVMVVAGFIGAGIGVAVDVAIHHHRSR